MLRMHDRSNEPMPVSEVTKQTQAIIGRYRTVISHRSDDLFRLFLPRGYRLTTLNSVAPSLRDTVILAKIHLGMLITLYDDLADHPRLHNPRLLRELYKLNVDQDASAAALSSEEAKLFELARSLFQDFTALVESLPNHVVLKDVLQFDIEQFYACNRFSSLVTQTPSIRNAQELKTLGPHNMGIIAAGTIDLMASPDFDLTELGSARLAFQLGQRLGRISNMLFTYQRELNEGDRTNEIFLTDASSESNRERLAHEFLECLGLLRAQKLRSFSIDAYAEGLQGLHELHRNLEGVI